MRCRPGRRRRVQPRAFLSSTSSSPRRAGARRCGGRLRSTTSAPCACFSTRREASPGTSTASTVAFISLPECSGPAKRTSSRQGFSIQGPPATRWTALVRPGRTHDQARRRRAQRSILARLRQFDAVALGPVVDVEGNDVGEALQRGCFHASQFQVSRTIAACLALKRHKRADVSHSVDEVIAGLPALAAHAPAYARHRRATISTVGDTHRTGDKFRLVGVATNAVADNGTEKCHRRFRGAAQVPLSSGRATASRSPSGSAASPCP